jgi:hypothetical protein
LKPRGRVLRRAGWLTGRSIVPAVLNALVVLAVAAGAAAESRGTSAGLVLNFPVGARALAMGEAYTASVGDLSGMHQNPAALGFLKTWGVSAFYQRRIAGDNFGGVDFSSAAGPGVIGLSFVYYSAGDVDLTGIGTGTRTVNALEDYVVAVSYAAGPMEDLQLGMTFKILRSTLVEEFDAWDGAVDFGLQYRPAGGRLLIGAAARHLGEGLSYMSNESPLPRTFALGLACLLEVAGGPMTLAGDAVKIRDLDLRCRLGFEYVVERVLAVRLGYRLGYDTSDFTFGLGVVIGGLEISHGVGVMQEFDDIQMTQVIYRF